MKTSKHSERVIFEPVTLDELKLYLKIDHDADDETLDRTRAAARQWVERYTSRDWSLKEVTYNVLGIGGVGTVKVEGFELISLEQDGQAVTPNEVLAFDGLEVTFESESRVVYQMKVKTGTEAPPEAITEAIKKIASLYYFERDTQGVGTKDIKTILMPFKSFLFV